MSTSSVAYASIQPQAPNAPKKEHNTNADIGKHEFFAKTSKMRNVITERGEKTPRKLYKPFNRRRPGKPKQMRRQSHNQEEEDDLSAIMF